MSESSAEKPATYGVFVWYNIGWLSTRFQTLKKHEETLGMDLWEATVTKAADVILLCECGDIDDGLGEEFLEVVRRCCCCSLGNWRTSFGQEIGSTLSLEAA